MVLSHWSFIGTGMQQYAGLPRPAGLEQGEQLDGFRLELIALLDGAALAEAESSAGKEEEPRT